MNRMDRSILRKLADSWKSFRRIEPENLALDTLRLFVNDTVHEILTVITALQSHIDLLHSEKIADKQSVARLEILVRNIDRIIMDTSELAIVSELSNKPLVIEKLFLEKLVREIVEETILEFSRSQVSLSFDVSKDLRMTGNAESLKFIIRKLILALLQNCKLFETVKIVGMSTSKLVSLTVDIGVNANKAPFKLWRLGELRLFPGNGDGITLSSIDAIARFNSGSLSVSTGPDLRHGYRLDFHH